MQLLLSLPAPEQTCQLVAEGGRACGATLPTDAKRAATHFRNAHAPQGGLQRKDHMLMAELWFTPHSTGEHYQAYSLSPSGAIEMDLSSMSEDICAEGDSTPLSPSKCAYVKVG